MVSSEPTANNFCPLPFTGLFYQNNSASPCCAMKTDPATPNEYLASKETDKLRKDFTNGLKPERCNNCWIKESNGLTSIRKHYSKQKRDLTKITHLELRESNLCNFSCRMCNPDDSVVIDRESKSNPEIQSFFRPNNDLATTDENWNQILEIVRGVESINLTGGEPMLMKRYYDLFDYMISIGKNEDVFLNIFTNGSVYNPLFVEKILKFKNVRLTVSIDAVEKISEYQRKGTNWSIVSSNISKYMQLPIDMGFHSTITAYSILGLSSLADFFVDLHNSKHVAKSLTFGAHTIRNPKKLEFTNLNIDLRVMAYREVEAAIEKLLPYEIFKSYVTELSTLKSQLLVRKDCDYKSFVGITKTLDRIRNDNFEEVFGYKI